MEELFELIRADFDACSPPFDRPRHNTTYDTCVLTDCFLCLVSPAHSQLSRDILNRVESTSSCALSSGSS